MQDHVNDSVKKNMLDSRDEQKKKKKVTASRAATHTFVLGGKGNQKKHQKSAEERGKLES